MIVKLSPIFSTVLIAFMSHSQAQAMLSAQSASLVIDSGNTLQNQAYLRYYNTDGNNAPLTSVTYDTVMSMSGYNPLMHTLDLNVDYYDRTHTYNLGVGISAQQPPSSAWIQTTYAAFDFTKYDEMYFRQAVLGADAKIFSYLVNMNLYLPIGGGSTDYKSNNGVLYPMLGADISFGKHIEQLLLQLHGSYFTEHNVDDDSSSVAISAEYNFNSQLKVAAKYQMINRPNGTDIGYSGSMRINLFDQHQADDVNGARYATHPRRMHGPLIQSVTG